MKCKNWRWRHTHKLLNVRWSEGILSNYDAIHRRFNFLKEHRKQNVSDTLLRNPHPQNNYFMCTSCTQCTSRIHLCSNLLTDPLSRMQQCISKVLSHRYKWRCPKVIITTFDPHVPDGTERLLFCYKSHWILSKLDSYVGLLLNSVQPKTKSTDWQVRMWCEWLNQLNQGSK